METALWFVIGLGALIGGAELLVRSVSKLAAWFGISKLIIGLTVVAFGTSAPELAVSINAGINGQTDLMLGNVIGSNISNIFFILGIAAIITPLKVNINLIRNDVPVMIGLTLLVFIFAWNGSISFRECLILSVLLGGYLYFLYRQSRQTETDSGEESNQTGSGLFLQIIIAGTGLVFLILGARWLVSSAVIFAQMAGVNELVIGLTVVAFGTSLPEVVTSVVAALRGERDIAVGSVVGSCILNILAVLGVSGLFIPEAIPVSDSVAGFDLLILIAASLACLPIFFTGHEISRWEGALFLIFYTSYATCLILSSTGHQALDLFNNTILWFVVPIASLTIGASVFREFKKKYRHPH